MYSAKQIACWFIRYNYNFIYLENKESDFITNLKLQKLLYYAQGVYYAITDKLLFKDEIQAWVHGPVVPEVYRKYKENGMNGIKYDEDDEDNVIIDNETLEILVSVYNTFGKYSAWGLREKTHEEAPWKETGINHEINVNKIKEYFLEHYVE